MIKNRLQMVFEEVSEKYEVLNLIDSNFHANGFLFPEEILSKYSSEYFKERLYTPDPKGSITARLSIKSYYRKHSIDINPEHIIITASTSESYNLLFSSLCASGDNVLLPCPSYPLFEYLADFKELECRFYSLDADKGYHIDIESIICQIDSRTRFIVLISPNNPTGQIITDREIYEIIDICGKHGIMIICDEVFAEFIHTPLKKLPRPASHKSEVTIFTLNGISKMFACPDLKLGWIAVNGGGGIENIVENLEITNDVFLSCNSLSQYLLPFLFEHGKEFQNNMLSRITANRSLLIDEISSCDNVSLSSMRGGIHSILRYSGKNKFIDNEEFAVKLLSEKHIYTHPGYFYGIEKDICLVISYLKEPRMFKHCLEQLKEFLKN